MPISPHEFKELIIDETMQKKPTKKEISKAIKGRQSPLHKTRIVKNEKKKDYYDKKEDRED